MLQEKRGMGSDPSSSGANWTLEMESYFIDLLLDQVHRGNRMGYTFNKQAWNEMHAFFKAKFGYPCDGNDLKSRYTNLWTRYNDIKNLLGQNGFYWDETRQMVIASDHVWDAYIKVHPGAQAYRGKAQVNIKDLSFIYTHKSADGRYSLSSHDVDVDDDVQVVNAINGVAARTPATLAREWPDGDWTVAMDIYFVKLMLSQLKNGNMIHNTFSTKAWSHMLKLFNKKFDAQHDKCFLQNRYNKLRTYYIDVKDLLESKDFFWDEKQQKIVADDYVWDNYIKVHPHVNTYRTKTLVNYRDLELIYGNSTCNGDWGHLQEGIENEYQSSDDSENVDGNWTLQMDCYLLDLLLNQAFKGNKTRHDFTFEVWCDIVTLFCAKFGSRYSTDAIKNRYNYLKGKHTDIKALIKQPGFVWDGKQEMITAKDDVWKSYSKVHPDAILYRNKFLPIYNKLCLMYGQDSEGRYNHSACSLDHVSNGPISTVGGDEGTQGCAIGDWSRTGWTPSMDRYLIDLMLEEVRRGNKIDYGPNNQVWIDMYILFKERFGIQIDKDYLKRRCRRLEKLYYDLRSIIEQRRFSWDETRQMITAYDGVLGTYIKERPDVKSYRNHRKPNYSDLCLIYGNSNTELACNLANQNAGYNGYSIKFQNSKRRNDWTPSKDRYFMDLMLEEVRNGSMVNYKFDKLTWRYMTAKFSAEFGSQYNTVVLKCRYMALRERFNDMKILLNQRGFAWDEMQQKITADDRLWDHYLKEHPDAKEYRNRTLPNFNDLFLIYGNTNSGKNQTFSGRSLDDTDAWEYSQSPANDEPLRIVWTTEMDQHLIGLFLEQLNRGNKTGDTFSEKAWSWVTTSFSEGFGLLCDRDALESRYFGLMTVYKDVTHLINQNGLAWDGIQLTSRANDIWEAYVEEHPDAFAFGDTIHNNYSDLCLLFGNPNKNRRPCVRIKLKASNDSLVDLKSSDREYKISEKRKRQNSLSMLTSPKARKVQKTLLNEMQEDILEKKDNSIEHIVAALQTVPGLDDELFLEACLLLEDERKAAMFVAMDARARRRWLLKKLYK